MARRLSLHKLQGGCTLDREKTGEIWEPDGTCIHTDTLTFGYVKMAHSPVAKSSYRRPDSDQNVFSAVGYYGKGVMHSAQDHKRVAKRVAHKADKAFDLAILTSLRPGNGVWTLFRRLGQRTAYAG